ncbi:MAG: Smr/MutS family protein [Bacteriovoracaceae bacterium]|nr:Smr/MutS family protein [Bacteriovoracaceae bacterium]
MELNLLTTEDLKNFEPFEWLHLCRIISSFAYFEKNKIELAKPNAFYPRSEIEKSHRIIQAFLKTADTMPVFQFESHISPYVDENKIGLIEKGAIFSLEDLNQLVCLIETAYALNEFLPQELAIISMSELRQIHNTAQKYFIKEFRSIVSPNAEINYMGHTRLREISQKIKSYEEAIKTTLKQLIKDPDISQSMQIPNFDLINDYFVLPIKTDSYRSSLGHIVSRSESGHTLYIEPFVIRNLVNQRLEMQGLFQEEINKICIKFSKKIGDPTNRLKDLYQIVTSFDFYYAKYRFSQSYGLCYPEISNDFEIELIGYYHPLIKNCVRNHFELQKREFATIISGPNTGGKSVTLKSILINILLLNKGLFLAAEKARLFLFQGVYFLGTDGQQIDHGLSSFSSEVMTFKSFLESSKNTNLLIVDEIFRSTSSQEASALAFGIFELIKKFGNTHIICSTHHEILKNVCFKTPGYQAAHVGFDLETHRPTYKIHLGSPGNSMAVDIFSQIFKNSAYQDSILSTANNVLAESVTPADEEMKKVQLKANELDKQIEANILENQNLKQLYKQEENLVALKISKAELEFRKKIQEYERTIENLLAKIESGEITNKNKISNILASVKTLVPQSSSSVPLLPSGDIQVGRNYFSKKLNSNVQVIKIHQKGNKVTIKSGHFQSEVLMTDLYAEVKGKSAKKARDSSHFVTDETKSFVLNCIGMRLDEFENTVFKNIAYLKNGDFPYLEIIHGHGEGILRKRLREILEQDHDLKWKLPSNGNDGATIVELS